MEIQEIIYKILSHFEELPEGKIELINRRNITDCPEEQFFGFIKDAYGVKVLFTEDMVSNEIDVTYMDENNASDLEFLLSELEANRVIVK